MNGTSLQLTSDQQAKLKEFRCNVSDILQPEHDDYYLVRWLRARSFDLKKSEKMLREHMDFRKRWDIDYIANHWTPPEALEKFFVGGVFGEDREGSPVWFDPYGHIDPKGIIMSATKHDFLRFKILACERIQQALAVSSKKHGRRIDAYTLVFDLDKVNFSHLWRPFVNLYNEVIKLWEANYPERLKVALVINTPKMFAVGFNLIKPFLSEETVAKAVIVDCHYRDAILKLISEENIPVHYGGTAVDENNDPKCRSKICFGGKVPRSYYLSDQLNLDNMKTMLVAHGEVKDLRFDVSVSGSVLKWEFKTDKCNICFGVFFQKDGRGTKLVHRSGKPRSYSGEDCPAAPVELLPLEKVNSEMVPEAGGLRCEEVGSYILRFSNSYSWIRSKKVHYSIEVMPPDTETPVYCGKTMT